MQKELVIRPIGAKNANIVLKFEYRDTKLNKDVMIPNDYSPVITSKDFFKNRIVLAYTFKGADDSFRFKWDDEDGQQNDIAIAMMRHPLVRCQGNDNCKNPIFELIEVTKQKANDALMIKKKGLVFNLVNNTSLGRMRDAGFAFGYNPLGKSYSEIFIDLVDFVRGVFMQDVDKAIKILENDIDQVKVVMKKAIILGVITNRDGLYYIKADVIGDTEDKVYNYLKENNGLYEQYVRKEVALKDKLDAQDYEKFVKDEVAVIPDVKTVRRRTLEEEIEMKELREEAKSLKIKGAHLIMTKERLQSVIQRAKEQIASGKEPQEVEETE